MRMPLHTKNTLLLCCLATLCSAIVLGTPESSLAACDQTLGVGANIASAVATAPNGSTICLNSGNYGTVSLYNISRSGFVTLSSASARGAQMSPQVGNSHYITFSSMTLTNMLLTSCSTNIRILNNTFVPDTPHLLFNYETACSGVADMKLLVDGNTFDRGRNALFNGRISVRGVNGATISNNIISNLPTANHSDGIFLNGGSRNVTIGPGNRFTGILQSLCTTSHCDCIQDYGAGPNNRIIGNVFDNSSTFLMMPDGSSYVTVEHNVFDGTGNSYNAEIQFGSAANSVFRHNTLKDASAGWSNKTGNPESTNALAENNLFYGASSIYIFNCTACTNRYNMYSSSGNASGANAIIGTPTFIGGSSPSSWAGWELVSGSVGTNAGSDGKDVGIDVGFGDDSGSVSAPPAPTNLVVR